MSWYQVRVGLNYPSPAVSDGERRVDPDTNVDDLPAGSVGWLLADGCIVAVDGPDAPPVDGTPDPPAEAPDAPAPDQPTEPPAESSQPPEPADQPTEQEG